MSEFVHEAIFSGWHARANNVAVVTRRTTGPPEHMAWAALEAFTQTIAQVLLLALRERRCGDAATSGFGAVLASPSQHHAGTRVAILATNSAAWVASFAAVSHCGLIAVPLNLQWSPEEAARVLADCGARLVLVDAAGQKLLEAASMRLSECGAPQIWALDLPLIGSLHHEWKPISRPLMIKANKPDEAHDQHSHHASSNSSASTHCGIAIDGGPVLPPEGTLTFLYTSGTTGAPKGVMHDHNAHLLQARCKIEHGLYSTPPNNAATVLLCPAPLYHVGGLNSALACLLARGTLVFPAGAADAKTAIVDHGATALVVVPALLQSIMGPPQEVADKKFGNLQAVATFATAAVALQRVQCVVVGGQALSPSLYQQCKSAMPHARIVQTYAQTEACSSITFHDLSNSGSHATDGCTHSDASSSTLSSKNHSSAAEPQPGNPIGSPAASFVEVALHPSSGDYGINRLHHSCRSKSETVDAPMELITRGPHVMLGYWRQPEATAASMLPGGWLRTGDLAIVDRAKSSLGGYRFVGRLKDLIKSGGENVVSGEVERVLLAHSSVAATAVFGVPDDRWGERVVAAMVLKPHHLPAAGYLTDASARTAAATASSTDGACAFATSVPTQPHHSTVVMNPEAKEVALVYDARAAPLELHAHCASRLSGFKVPKQFLFVPAYQWPTTATGKVQKHKLLTIFAGAIKERSEPGPRLQTEKAQEELQMALRSRL